MTPSAIPSGSKILLDSMTVIYFLEQHEQYGELARQVFQRIEPHELEKCRATLRFCPTYNYNYNSSGNAVIFMGIK